MFDRYAEIHLRKIPSINKRNAYSLFFKEDIIGTIKETPVSSSKTGKRLVHKLIPHRVIELEFILQDAKANTLGTIRKERGFQKDLLLYSETEQHIATLKPSGKIKSPTITVTDTNGKNLMTADGNYGATDFSVRDNRANRQISYLKKRPFEQVSFKDRLKNRDSYYNIENHVGECLETFALITMCITLDLYFCE